MSEQRSEEQTECEKHSGDEHEGETHMFIDLCRRKRASKRSAIKIRHQLSLSTAQTPLVIEEIEHGISNMWRALEETQQLLDELCVHYLDQKDYEMRKAVTKESEKLEMECHQAIEEAQAVLLAKSGFAVGSPKIVVDAGATESSSGNQINPGPAATTVKTDDGRTQSNTVDIGEQSTQPGSTSTSSAESIPVQASASSSESSSTNRVSPQPETTTGAENRQGLPINHRLKQLKVPEFDGDKTKFEEYWGLFQSLVDKSPEATGLKMARLRQSLSGRALEAIRGLGVSEPEYEEAKEILKSKFGGQRRQLRAYLDELEKMSPLNNKDIHGFEKFSDLVRVTVVKLQAEGKDSELGDGTLHSILVKKLTEEQLKSYTRWMKENKKERSVAALRDWLKEEVAIRVDAVEMAYGVGGDEEDGKIRRVPSKDGAKGKQRSFHTAGGNPNNISRSAEPRRKPPCEFCNGASHGIWFCRSFQQKSVEDRWNIAKDKQLCFRCLGKDHRGRECKRSQPCKIEGCQRNHHHLLHRQAAVPPASEPETSVTPGEGASSQDNPTKRKGFNSVTNSSATGEHWSLRTIPVWLKANGRKMKVNAILDDASNETFINEEVASYLGVKEPFVNVQVNVLNSAVETFQSMPVKVDIESVNGVFTKTIEAKTCPSRVTGNYQVEDWNEEKEQWAHLKQCDFPKPAKEGMVDLLIGVDNAELHYSRTDIQGPAGGPIARLGPLGWTCIGATSKEASKGERSHLVRSFLSTKPQQDVESCCDVSSTLKKFWEVEKYGTDVERAQVMTQEEKIALEKVGSSITYTGSRYRVSVPWKQDCPELPNNRETAVKRLESTEKNLKRKDSFVQNEYGGTIKAYVEKGYLRKVSPDETPPICTWYLPHFAIVKLEKKTSKVRIVFDCSAKHEGVSLNDVIYPGPKLQTELFDVLLRFRRHPCGIACDIREMYLQIEIEEKDRPYFRILWRDGSDQEPDEYEFTRVVFGKNSAPMEAQFVAQENARRHRDQYPLAAETVLKSTYMDDSIDSIEDEEKGMELSQQLQDLWGIAGMQARKWVSNSERVLASIPEEYRASELVINNDDQPVTKALGLVWFSSEDTLAVSAPSPVLTTPVTKRMVLKKIATVFDPLGLISPVVVRGKILLQILWSRGYDWDDEVQDDVVNEIQAWFEQLSSISTIRIPRCIRDSATVTSFKLVTFADASTSAYGAAVYGRFEYEQPHPPTCRLIAAKSRVAPLVPVTVPRLELMAAVLGLRLTQTIVKVFQVSMSVVTFYSDSLDVLWWIRGHGRDFRAFVANRVGEIQSSSDPQQWQHVPTDQNPADLVSRGVSSGEIKENNLWCNGPSWLLEKEECWPRAKQKPPKEIKESKTATVHLSRFINPVSHGRNDEAGKEWKLNPDRYSSWMRLVRIRARVVRVVTNMNPANEKIQEMVLLPQEITDAEGDVIRQAQFEAFPDEYKALKSKKPISPKSSLVKLSPRIDESGVMRLEGRLMYAEYLPYDVKFPIILPRGHQVTKLIVKHYHEMANHSAGTNFILSQISQRFWIIAAREEIRSWESECNECKKRRSKLGSQVMAPLPAVRLRFTYRPFDQCAVDYAGPFITIQGRGRKREKRYLCLFTCVATRAIHLEMSWGLDTESFLNAFTRFTSRRGVPTEMISDNGTNFVGAVNELRDLVNQLDEDQIRRRTVNMFNKVTWHFNPPAGPHFGGIHEAMIKSAKRAIYAVLGNGDVRDEELLTAFTAVEGLLNSRPLTYPSSDSRDATPLTPNHFLHGQMGGELAPESVDTTDFNLKNRWRVVQQLISQVWKRWLHEYLPTLNKRPKWTEIVKDMKVDDVVLALDPDLPRGRWPLARILKIFPGKDGHTRVAKILCGGRTLVRPIHKLVPLSLD